MTRNSDQPQSALRIFSTRVVAVFGLSFVAACSSYEKLPQQSFDLDYKVFSAISNKSGSMNVFFIKLFEADGMLAMCGGYSRGDSSFAKQGARYWADVSKINLGGTEVGSAEFMNEMPVYGIKASAEFSDFIKALSDGRPATNCVRTDIAWKPAFANMEIQRTGPSTIRIVD